METTVPARYDRSRSAEEPADKCHEGQKDRDEGDHRPSGPWFGHSDRYWQQHSWHNSGAAREHTALQQELQGSACRATTETINSTSCSNHSNSASHPPRIRLRHEAGHRPKLTLLNPLPRPHRTSLLSTQHAPLSHARRAGPRTHRSITTASGAVHA